jgi:hypothetical protein
MAENKHLLVGHAIQMVRALGLGSSSKAVSARSYEEVIKDPKDFDKVVRAGVSWFGTILDHFKMETLPNGERDASVFTDPDRVIRAMPIKVALGVMGNAWVDINLPKQHEYRAALDEINWRVSPVWNGIAGKVKPAVKKTKVNGKIVSEVIPDTYTLAAPGVKEVGANAVRALTNPETNDGKAVRGRAVGTSDAEETDVA